MNKDCYIAEDLLPLYTEELLQEETAEWLESHIQSCPHCRELAQLSKEPVEKEPIISTIHHEKMMAKINVKLSIFQMIFVGLSFFFAIRTSILNESFGFILSYTTLGLISYLFYRNFILIFAISFFPIMLWSLSETISLMAEGEFTGSSGSFFFTSLLGSGFLASIHTIFAILGSLIGLLIFKIKERG